MGGLVPGEMIVIAGRPGGGKTALGLNIAINQVTRKEPTPVLFFSMEMTVRELAARVLFAEHQLYARALEELVTRPYCADWLLERVSEIALALPEAEARESHGAPGWHTGGKSGT